VKIPIVRLFGHHFPAKVRREFAHAEDKARDVRLTATVVWENNPDGTPGPKRFRYQLWITFSSSSVRYYENRSKEPAVAPFLMPIDWSVIWLSLPANVALTHVPAETGYTMQLWNHGLAIVDVEVWGKQPILAAASDSSDPLFTGLEPEGVSSGTLYHFSGHWREPKD